jgi:hypothetical protein
VDIGIKLCIPNMIMEVGRLICCIRHVHAEATVHNTKIAIRKHFH